MFKKILQSLSKSHAAKPAAPAVTAPPSVIKPLAPAARSTPVLDKITRAAPTPTAPTSAPKSPEDLCEIGPKMSKDQIRERLKFLYRRYNRSASSLDASIRAQAEVMLDAIVRVREKNFGEI